VKAKYISYQDTHSFSKLVIDYVNDVEALKPFYSYRPDLDGLKAAIEQHHFSGNRATLVAVLKEQYRNIKIHRAVSQHIDLLLNENTFTVTTGHQLNLFTGPLYFIYKIVSTINLALTLKIAHPDKNFVPIYWMATEDHDFEEINHVNIEDSAIHWQQQHQGGATGRLSTSSLQEVVKAYQSYLGISENGKKLAKLVEEAYLQHQNLADATRYLTNALFEQYGLVILDADDNRLKKLFAPIIKQDLIERISFQKIEQTKQRLEQSAYKNQVNGREINFFYLKDHLRERIVFENGNYHIKQQHICFTEAELLQEIDQHPDRFSPNVIMRPLYQEVILPNLAYIGGGAEVSYWLQLKAIFDYYQVSFPSLLLRNSALVLDRRSQQNLQRLDLELEDIFLPLHQLHNKWVQKNQGIATSLSDEKAMMRGIFDRIGLYSYKIDKSLEASSKATLHQIEKRIDRLEKKLINAAKRNHQISIDQITNLKQRLFPKGVLQERVQNIASLYVNYGDDFIASLVEGFDPLGGDFTVILA